MRLKVIQEIKNVRDIIPALLVLLTGKKRQITNKIEWSDTSITHNIFRIFEYFFWCSHGIKTQIVWFHTNKWSTYQAYTIEWNIALVEFFLRKIFKKISILKDIKIVKPISVEWFWNPNCMFAILLDANTSSTGTMSAGTDTFSHTCTGSNRELIVNAYNSWVAIPNSITYNSASLTKQIQNTASWNPLSSMWSRNAPSTWSNTVSISTGWTSWSHTYIYISASFTGVLQGSEIWTSGTSATTLSITLTTLKAKSFVIMLAVVANSWGSPATSGSNQTIIWSAVTSTGTNVIVWAMSRQSTTTTWNYTSSWSGTLWGTARSCALELYELPDSARGFFIRLIAN